MQEHEEAARLSFLESAYDWSLPEDVWLERLLDSAMRLWGRPKFGFAYIYDASDTSNFRIGKPAVGGPSGFGDVLAQTLPRYEKLPAEIVAATYRSVAVGFGRPIGVIDAEGDRTLADMAAADVFALNGLDATGRACAIGMG